MSSVVHPAAPAVPAWHLAPPVGWMNDPNGLTFVAGRWHAFFQHHPFDDHWGPMHWGHASSADGLQWDHHPIALSPDHLGTVFSGSVVHDHRGTAGFGVGALVALFTHHAGDLQHQSIAGSIDGGLTWTTYDGNPVIPGDSPDFRDPKVCRLPGGRWLMVVTRRDHLQFFESSDLVHWDPVGTFTADVGATLGIVDVGAWECPDMVRLTGGGWLLVVSLAAGGPQGQSGVVGWLGDYSAGSFVPSGPAMRLDHGPDCYALQTFSEAGDRDPVGMAWANSWNYANSLPSAGRRGLLTLPRSLSVDVEGVVWCWPAVAPSTASHGGAQWLQSDRDLVVTLEGVDGSVTVGVQDGAAFVRRLGDHTAGYAGSFEVAAEWPGPHLLVVDHGVVELFGCGGRVALTAQVMAGADPVVTVRRT